MLCKKCGCELEEECTKCPECGAKVKVPVNPWRIAMIVTASLTGLLLLALLAGLVHYGVTGSFLPRKNDIFNKTTYSVTAEKLSNAKELKSFLGKMDKTVATLGEHKLSNRMLQLYYWQTVRSSSYVDVDTSKPLDTQIQDPATGLTWQQFFLQKALEQWKQDMILADHAKAANYEMPADYAKQFETLEADLLQQAVANGYTSVDAMIQDSMGPAADFDTYYDFMWYYYYGALYLAEYMEALEISQAELEQFFTENEEALKNDYAIEITKDSGYLIDVRHILVEIEGTGKDENGKTVITDADWEACRQAAQKLLDEFLAGEQTEDAFGALASKNSADSGSASKGGLYEYVYPGQMVKEFDAWCFDTARKSGDTGLVKSEYGYHVMYYVYGDEGWVRICTDGARSEKVQQLTDGWLLEQTLEADYRSIVIGETEEFASK